MGGCCRKISREHIVTENLFIGGTIGVKGFPWCQKTPKLIRKEEFTSNILCERHNNMLSQVDQAGIDAFAAFRKLAELNDQRLKALAAKSPVLRRKISQFFWHCSYALPRIDHTQAEKLVDAWSGSLVFDLC